MSNALGLPGFDIGLYEAARSTIVEAASLLAWYATSARDLPWRTAAHARDPYARLVSEVMLQQTRVSTVVERFEAWMARWPTAEALAEADEDELLAAWAGLGYYARARRLHAAAKVVASNGWPSDAKGLEGLPGLGPYTAAALASMVFDEPAPAVDGNVARVVIRHEALLLDAGAPAARQAVTRRLAHAVPEAGPGQFNEALIELGATVCTPTTPACDACPWAKSCQALAKQEVASLPLRPPRKRPQLVVMTAGLATTDSDAGSPPSVLLRRRGGGLLAGAWGLPMWPTAEPAPPGLALIGDQPAGTIEHVFTHRKWRVDVRPVSLEPTYLDEAFEWVPTHELAGRLHTRLDQKVMAAAGLL